MEKCYETEKGFQFGFFLLRFYTYLGKGGITHFYNTHYSHSGVEMEEPGDLFAHLNVRTRAVGPPGAGGGRAAYAREGRAGFNNVEFFNSLGRWLWGCFLCPNG